MQKVTIRVVLTRHVGELMEIPGVTGVAEGTLRGKPCIRVFVTNKSSAVRTRIPGTIEGYPVEVEASGEFRALSS